MIIHGDVREQIKALNDKSVQCVVTSPPYFGLRDYGVDGQIGLENTLDEYITEMVQVFREVHRVLADDGVLWLNLGDSYNGSGGAGGDYNVGGLREGQPKYKGRNDRSLPPKSLLGVPWRVAFALQEDGWILRQDVIWQKPNPMPESVKDRCCRAHEYVFMFTKKPQYYYDHKAIMEPAVSRPQRRLTKRADHPKGDEGRGAHRRPPGGDGSNPFRNKRSVWTITSKAFKGAHFAVMPEALAEPCILATSRVGDVVLDPFAGSGTVGVVALRHERQFIGIELNLEYATMGNNRIHRFIMGGEG